MKVLTQNFKTGELSVGEYPYPGLGENEALIATTCSAVSYGTEKAVVALAKSNPIQKIKKRPDLALKVWNKAKNEGLFNTLKVVQNLVASPVPLGYSSCGVVLRTGYRCNRFQVGDRVACAGYGYANHAEVNAVPANLLCKIPDGVSDEDAAFTTIACVAMHALRVSEAQPGELVCILGLGLIGQIAARLAVIQGLRVVGFDPDRSQVQSASRYEPDGYYANNSDLLNARVEALSNGRGCDHVLLCASSGGEAIFKQAGQLARERGKVVVVGDLDCEMPRRLYYDKELDVKFSRAYGPGRYDHEYEVKGNDYPYSHVRWTMQRNMEAVLNLFSTRQLSMSGLTTHRFPLEEADTQLEALFSNKDERALGVLLNTTGAVEDVPIRIAGSPKKASSGDKIKLGIIGAGLFGQGVLIPALKKNREFDLHKICSDKGLSAVAAAKKFGIDEAVSDPEAIIEDPAINAVVILTNHGTHADLICRCLEKGKHVFCEKPLALNTSELERVKEAEENSGGILMIGFNRRFAPFTQKLKELFSTSNEPTQLLYRINAGAQAADHWVHDPVKGGGRIIGEVCHYVDLASYLIGSEPTRVFANSTSGESAGETYYDNCSLSISYENGSIANINFVANGDTSIPKEYLEIHQGNATAVNSNFCKLEYRGNKSSYKKRLWNQQKGFEQEITAFLEACKTGIAPIPFAELYTTSLVTFSAMNSIATGDEETLVPDKASGE